MLLYLAIAGVAFLLLSKKTVDAGVASPPVQVEATFEGGLSPGAYINMGGGQASAEEPAPGTMLEQAAAEIEQATNAAAQETTAWLVSTGSLIYSRAKEAVNVTVQTGKRGG